MAVTENEESWYAARRQDMVTRQLEGRGIKNDRVLAAMAAVPRHRFVDRSLVDAAYEDRPLSIGGGQTISQPFMVARVTELAAPQPGDKALEIGTGCGYQLAVLARLCQRAYGVELLGDLATRAQETLRELGIENALVGTFDGSGGWAEHAPYNVIVVSAGAPRIPALLVGQLADGGRLVIPVGPPEDQQLTVVRRVGDSYTTELDTKCRYVNLLGRYGFGQTPPVA